MLFEDKYPDAKEGETYNGDNYIWTPKADNCYVCGRLTHFIELNAGCHMCSEECDENFYLQMYMHATNSKLIDF